MLHSLLEGKWSCYRSGHFKRGRMLMLWRWPGLRMVLLQRQSIYWRGIGHVREVASLMEGEWSCYRGGQFKEGESLQRWPV